VETGSGDRIANMRTFAAAALDLLAQSIAAAQR
jgi:repressor of nif and glnA expression